MEDIPKEMLEQMKIAFEKIDTNHDGKLTREEIQACVKKLECEMPEDKLSEIVESCNPGSKEFTFEEMINHAPDALMKVLLFLMMDKNNDNRINYDEFKSMTSIAAGDIPNEEQLKELFNAIDKNHDGLISLTELIASDD